MKFLGQVGRENRERIATIFESRNFKSFEASLRSFSTIAYQLQNIFPRSQYDRPNPEYRGLMFYQLRRQSIMCLKSGVNWNKQKAAS